jgi:hypothetical protein
MSDTCYLCGQPVLPGQKISRDHVIPATLISRSQPIARGFDHGGFLPTHEECNNRFGNETYVSKALDLLGILCAPSAASPLQLRDHPDITIFPLDASTLLHFTPRDLRFFKFNDARNVSLADLRNPSFYAGCVKTNPTRDALFVALSVLAKSAAALLVKRHLRATPPCWRIYAQAFSGDTNRLDFAEFLGDAKPFDNDVRVWVKEMENDNWFVVYAAKGVLVYFVFAFRDRARLLEFFRSSNPEAETVKFVGTSINELLVLGWRS